MKASETQSAVSTGLW